MKKLLVFPLILLTLFTSCKKDNGSSSSSTTVTAQMAKDSVYYTMNNWYYWYKLMPTVNKDNYSDPYAILDAMMYKTLDKWSFVEDYNTFVAEMEGTFVGHGFRIGLDDSLNARIAMIYLNAPLYASGVRRGWIVKTINGTALAPILEANDETAYSNLIGASVAGITNVFVFRKPNGVDTTISSTKASFTVNSVILCDTLHLSNGKVVGHLVLDSFILPTTAELTTAFEYFNSVGVTDLVLDLRYNTGGYLDIAQGLASYIGGNTLSANGDLFAQLTYNDKQQAYNTAFLFQTSLYPLGLSRIVIITTRLTASASEAVVNGLKPFLNVVSVGDTTYGKPVGMNGWAFGEQYVFYPITFKLVNADGQGDYFAGLPPNKVVSDDITHDFSDKNELCYQEAIHYLEYGSVSSKSYMPFSRHANFSEKPKWMEKGMAIEKLKK